MQQGKNKRGHKRYTDWEGRNINWAFTDDMINVKNPKESIKKQANKHLK